MAPETIAELTTARTVIADHPCRARIGGQGLDEAAARVRPAAELADPARVVQRVVPRIGVGLEITGKGGEKRVRPVALVRPRGVEDHLRDQRIEIRPDATLPAAGLLENGDGRVVGLQIARGRDLAARATFGVLHDGMSYGVVGTGWSAGSSSARKCSRAAAACDCAGAGRTHRDTRSARGHVRRRA